MLGHPALVLVQARIFRPVVLSRRAVRSFAKFTRENFHRGQLGFHFTSQLHVKSAKFFSFRKSPKTAANE